MKRTIVLLSVLTLIAMIVSCGNSSKNVAKTQTNTPNSAVQQSQQQLLLKPFPAFPEENANARQASATAEDPIKGTSWFAAKGAVNHIDFDNPDGYSIISNDANRLAYAQYATDVFLNRPVKLNIKANATKLDKLDPKTLDFEYHVALANFTSRSWDWLGPFTGDQSIELNSASKRDRYLSPTSKLHYVVVVAQNTTGQTIGASVATTQTDSSPTALSTLPLYSAVSIIHMGANIEDLSVKRLSGIGPYQELTLVWWHKEVLITEDSATEYEVYSNSLGDKNPFLIGTVASPGKDGMVTFKVPSDVIPAEQSKFFAGGTYQFYLKSKNAQGTARRSWANTATVPNIMPPTNLVASTNEAAGIRLTWKKASGVTSYKVYRDKQDKSIATLGDVSTYFDNSVKDSKDHKYWLVSIDGTEESSFSLGATGAAVSLDEPLAVPQNVTASTDLVGRILITWDAVPGAEAYHIIIDNLDLSYGSQNTKYLDLAITDPEYHEYKVQAISRVRPNSDFSTPVKGKINGVGGSLPDATNTEATALNLTETEFKWSHIPGAKYYLVVGAYFGYQIQLSQDLKTNIYKDTVTESGRYGGYRVYGLTDTDKSVECNYSSGAKNATEDIYEPDNTAAKALPLAVASENNTLFRSLSSPSDIDWFSFTANKLETFNFFTLSAGMLQMHLYSSSGELLSADTYYQGPESNSFVQFTAPETGTYFIQVSSNNGNVNYYYFVYNKGSYTLIPPDVEATTTRSDGVLLTYNKIPGVKGYKIYRDKLDIPIADIKDDETTEYLDKVKDYNPHPYWIVTYDSTSTSSPSLYKVGQVVEPDSYEPDNDKTNAKLLTPVASVKSQERSFSPKEDLDFLILNGVKDVNYRFWSVSSYDTFITVYDNTMAKIASNDDSGPAWNFYLNFKPTATAVYYIELKSFNNGTAGKYTFYYTTSNSQIFYVDLSTSSSLDTGIELKWTQWPTADGYRIYRDSLDNKITEVGMVGTYLDTTVSDMLHHRYWVQPFNATTDFIYSNPSNGLRVAKDSYESDDTAGTAKTMVLDTKIEQKAHSIYPPADEDWYKFNTTADTMYIFLVKPLGQNLPTTTILESDGKTIVAEHTSNRIRWIAPKPDTYYIRFKLSDKTLNTAYNLFYYATSDTFPYPPPKNVQASSIYSDYIELSWNPVPGCTRYHIYVDDVLMYRASAAFTSLKIQWIDDYNNHDFWVSASYTAGSDENDDSGIESKPSIKATGKRLRTLSNKWQNTQLFSQDLATAFVPVMLKTGKPAMVFTSASGKGTYAHSTVQIPASVLDWSNYELSTAAIIAPDITLIDSKPASSFTIGNVLNYAYSTKESPSVKADWVQFALAESSDGNFTKIASVDEKPGILYSNKNNLYFIQSKSNPPKDGKSLSWESPVLLSPIQVNQAFDLDVDPKTGFPVATFVNNKGALCFAYASKLTPSVIGDWTLLEFSTNASKPNLAFVGGLPRIIYYLNGTSRIYMKSAKISTPSLTDWTDNLIFNICSANSFLQIVTLSNGKPAIAFNDITKHTRVATTNSANPINMYDWQIYDIDSSASYNDHTYLLENTKLSVVYSLNMDDTIYYATLE